MNAGLPWALLAFGVWGFFPLYYRELVELSPLALLLHRVVWSVVFLVLVLTWRGQWVWFGPVLRSASSILRARRVSTSSEDQAPARLVATYAASAVLIATNWLLYVWAVHEHHVVEASLGYFLNPLLNVVLGVWLLRERLTRWQWLAVALAALGVIWLTAHAGRAPWIALALGGTFAVYGWLRKTSPLGPLEGLTLETLMLFPFALVALGVGSIQAHAAPGSLWWPESSWTWMLMLLSGPITAIPLLAFAAAARRLSLATLGLVQYMTPSLQLLQGVWLFGEDFGPDRALGFGLIWAGLLLVSARALWDLRRQRMPES